MHFHKIIGTFSKIYKRSCVIPMHILENFHEILYCLFFAALMPKSM